MTKKEFVQLYKEKTGLTTTADAERKVEAFLNK